MAVRQVVAGLYMISVGPVNTFLIESNDGLTLIDTGLPGSADPIFKALADLGKPRSAIRHILLTHAHAGPYRQLGRIQKGYRCRDIYASC